MKVNRRSSQPLYAQLKGLLLARIEKEEYPPGSKIPSELELCRELDLSRPTVRQAVAELVQEGVLYIIKGKGTFVAAEPERMELSNFSPFSFSLLAAKSRDDWHDLSIASIKGDPDIDQLFEIREGAGHPGYWSIQWRLTADEETLAVCQSRIPVFMFPELGDDLRADRRMIDITANKYAYLPQKAQARIFLRTAAGKEADFFDMERTTPLLVVQTRLRSRSGHCCEWVQAMMRSDRITLSMDAGRS